MSGKVDQDQYPAFQQSYIETAYRELEVVEFEVWDIKHTYARPLVYTWEFLGVTLAVRLAQQYYRSGTLPDLAWLQARRLHENVIHHMLLFGASTLLLSLRTWYYNRAANSMAEKMNMAKLRKRVETKIAIYLRDAGAEDDILAQRNAWVKSEGYAWSPKFGDELLRAAYARVNLLGDDSSIDKEVLASTPVKRPY